MTLTIKAHFDGRFFVPDEPVTFPINHPVTLMVRSNGDLDADGPPERSLAERLAALDSLCGCVCAPDLPDEAFDRASIYDRE